MSCYQVRLAEDQELEEEEGDDSKDEGKTILKNKLPSCAEWTFILEEMCENFWDVNMFLCHYYQ